MTIITCTSPLHLYFYKEFASVFGNEEKQQQNFQSLLTDFPEFMKIDTDIFKSFHNIFIKHYLLNDIYIFNRNFNRISYFYDKRICFLFL